MRVLAVCGATSIVFFLPLWLFQWWAIGRPFGFHLETHTLKTTGIGTFLSMRPRVLYNLLLAAHESMLVSILMSVPLLVAFIVRPKLHWRVFRVAFPLFGLFAVVETLVTLSGFRGPDGPILALDRSNGLFACVPILALGFMRLAGKGEDSDIEYRLSLNGVETKLFVHAAVQYHLYHKLQKRSAANEELYRTVENEKIIKTPAGLDLIPQGEWVEL